MAHTHFARQQNARPSTVTQRLLPSTHRPADLDILPVGSHATGHKPAKASLACTGSNAGKWAFCLDAPCSVEKGAVSCRCQLNPPSDYYTFTNACPADGTALREIWSAASHVELLSGFSQLTPFYGNPPKLAYCPASSTGGPAAR
jgi:hypothetical protein